MSDEKVLLLDDEQNVLTSIRRLMRKEPFELRETTSPEEALNLLESERFAVVISDQRMPSMDGTEFLEKAAQISRDTVRIVLTGYVDIQSAIESINRGAVYRFVTKPWNDEELRLTIEQALARYRMEQENRRLHQLTQKQNGELRARNQSLAEARAHEVEIGAHIQRTLLTGAHDLDFPSLVVGARALPSQEIDGDFFDFLQLHENCLDVVIGDVMGKGVPAALLGAATKSQLLRAICELLASRGSAARVDEIISAVHRQATPRLIGIDSFVTLCYARFDLQNASVSLVDCGHTGTVRYNPRTGTSSVLKGDNMPIGFSEKESYEAFTSPIEEGDLFFFYSDGLSETTNPQGTMFGEDRLIGMIKNYTEEGPDALVDRICNTVRTFAAPGEPQDDLTCLAVEVQDLPTGPRAQTVAMAPATVHAASPSNGNSWTTEREDR